MFKVLASITIVNSAFQIALPVMLPHFLFKGERIPLCVSWHFLSHLLSAVLSLTCQGIPEIIENTGEFQFPFFFVSRVSLDNSSCPLSQVS